VVLAACGGAVPPPAPLPHTATAHYLEARLAATHDAWDVAADALADAAAAAPDQPMLAVELARAQHKAKRDAAAVATLAQARAKWPRHEQVWLASGDQLAKSAPAEAIKAYRRAIALAPDDERAYLGLAKLEPPAAALVTLRELVRRVPTSTDGHYRLAQRYAAARGLPQAIRELRAVLELDPDHIDARIDLSRALRITGKLPEAIAQARSAFDRSGQAMDLAEELFFLLCEADDRTAALDLLTLLDDDRSDLEALGTVVRLQRGLGRLDAARALAARMTKLDADAGALALAETDIAGGDAPGAAKRALAIAESSKSFIDARRVAAAALLAAGQPQRALDALAPARVKKPADIDLATLAAFATVDLGRPADARALIVGDDANAQFARARVADRAGDVAGALALVEPLVRAKPDAGPALNLAGYLLADSGRRLADAERYLARAREVSPGDPAILDSWGWLLYKQGKSRAAVRVLDQAARYAPREPEILVHLAAAWISDGAPRTAAGVLDAAAALHPRPQVLRLLDAQRARLPR
jgi:tetratricopeptide (TPR) repeat protein